MKRLVLAACICFLVAADKKEETAEAVKLLKSKKLAERNKGLEDLTKLGADAKTASADVLAAMLAQYPKERDKFLEVVEKIDPEIFKHVVTILTDQDTDNHKLAIVSLKTLGKDAAGSVPVLLAYLRSNNQTIRISVRSQKAALDALPEIAPTNKDAATTVLSVIAAPNGSFQSASRLEALEAARSMKLEPKSVVPAVIVALGDLNYRLKMIEALGDFGQDAKVALPVLMKLKFDQQKEIRDAATAAVEKIKG